ncbi:TlpA family protein disulfide reductase [Alteromonas sp. a30]|uniref:TlpA family protein disulfide reductase n=1 Tax=Alteromonas sp. a30 TaxID=2730917 RepID=UPI002282FF5E|nr:TlpA disulfide reductase family protein [Alteromonas sp. a30]MCY7294103.1 TlpA family protein disulfide reductase [Alteromonas sp. a30]
MKKLALVIMGVIAIGGGALSYQFSRADFSTLQGEKLTWRELQGDWIVLNYFAEWCVPCLKEVPELNAFSHAIDGHNIQLFAASFDALNATELAALKSKYDMHFALIQSFPEPKLPVTKPQQLPATFLISPEGKVVKTLLGEQTQDSLFNAIARAKQAQS